MGPPMIPQRASFRQANGPRRPSAPGRIASAGTRTPVSVMSHWIEARMASFGSLGGGGHPRGGGGDEKAADAVLGARPDDGDVRDRREADPSFGAVDDPAVAGPPRGRGHAGRVAASFGVRAA